MGNVDYYESTVSSYRIPTLTTIFGVFSSAHGMPGSNWQVYSAAQSAIANNTGCGDSLAASLHSLQDARSHAIPGHGLLDHLLLPLIGLPGPDDCDAKRNKALRDDAIKASTEVLQEFLKARGSNKRCRGIE